VAGSNVFLYVPRKGYRTRDGVGFLGPTIEYYLASVPQDPVIIEILDSDGQLVNSYSSATPARPASQGRMGGGRRFGGAPAPRVTRNEGHNRVVWNVENSSGVGVPPGEYRVRLTVGNTVLTQRLTVLIDPRLAEEGLTVAYLWQQFEHNMTMQAMVEEVNALVSRVEAALERLEGATGADARRREQVQAVADKLITAPIRYSPPGLRDHITYLARMTSGVDQRVGRDAFERYETLRGELDEVTAEVNDLLGPGGS